MTRHVFEAQCYAPQSAYHETVEVTVNAQGHWQFEFQSQPVFSFFDQLTISARLGNTPRFVDLDNGIRLETAANDLIDDIIRAQTQSKQPSLWLHHIERSIQWILVLLVVVAVSSVAIYQFGIPVLSKIISPAIPNQVRVLASEQTLRQMDQLMLDDTALFSYERRHYRELLQDRLQPLIETPIKLEFRDSEAMGANAFALPDGTVVFTDQLITALSDEEFLAIAAHEMGHVAGDHGMRSVITSTSLLVAITLMTGDSEAISELLITAPTLLMQLSYSRNLEAEADDYAIEFMNATELDLEHYATAMEKILHEHDILKDENGWMTYFSTHPEPYERIAKFRKPAQ